MVVAGCSRNEEESAVLVGRVALEQQQQGLKHRVTKSASDRGVVDHSFKIINQNAGIGGLVGVLEDLVDAMDLL